MAAKEGFHHPYHEVKTEEGIVYSWDVLKPLHIRILRRVAQGFSTKEIAKELGYSVKNIEHYLGGDDTRSIYLKIGVSNRAQAAMWYTDMIYRPLLFPLKPEVDDWVTRAETIISEDTSIPTNQKDRILVGVLYQSLNERYRTVVEEAAHFLLFRQTSELKK